MIKVNIVKLPPEAQALAREIEDTLAQMVSKTVKSMVGVDNNLENLEITVYEALRKLVTEQGTAATRLIIDPETEVEPEVPTGFYDFEKTPQYITPSVSLKSKELDNCINLFVQSPDFETDFEKFKKKHPKCANIIKRFKVLEDEDKRKIEFKRKVNAAKKKEEDKRNYPVG